MFLTKILYCFFLISASSLQAQSFDSTVSYPADDKKTNSNLDSIKTKLFNSDLYRNNYLLRKRLPLNLYNDNVNRTNLLNFDRKNIGRNIFYIPNNFARRSQIIELINYQIIKSKSELYRILALKYQERRKYDLGELGAYLGLSKNITAIILAIISIAK